jgi:hypothetical protein
MNKEIELKPCREAFEVWAGQPFMYSNLTKSDDGEWYMNNETQNAWCGWQAAQAQLQAENERLRSALEAIIKAEGIILTVNPPIAQATYIAKAALQRNEAK